MFGGEERALARDGLGSEHEDSTPALRLNNMRESKLFGIHRALQKFITLAARGIRLVEPWQDRLSLYQCTTGGCWRPGSCSHGLEGSAQPRHASSHLRGASRSSHVPIS